MEIAVVKKEKPADKTEESESNEPVDSNEKGEISEPSMMALVFKMRYGDLTNEPML